jgi:hypothetical protein
LKPVRKRKLVDEMRGDCDVSIGLARRVFLVNMSTCRHQFCRSEFFIFDPLKD